MADDTNTLQPDDSVTASVGHADGAVVTGADDVKEKVVYDYDDNGEFAGWHKEIVK